MKEEKILQSFLEKKRRAEMAMSETRKSSFTSEKINKREEIII